MSHEYKNIISIKNLCDAWTEFICDKKSRKDVAEFSLRLSQNIFRLHDDLRTMTYRHGSYEAFSISDPKPRSIHKATVRDRLLHHAIYRIIYLYFDKKFIYDSYSCRQLKGAHRALNRFNDFVMQVSQSNSRTCWVLKCDIRKFFASIDHKKLVQFFKRHIGDVDTVWLIERVIESFQSTGRGKGLPLGNLTSQLLVNIYMNEFDQYIKHQLRLKYYIRYADDFIIMHHDKGTLMDILPKVQSFLNEQLKLLLHPNKVFIKTATSGVDFLGWVHFPTHRVLRTVTKRRMLKRIKETNGKKETVQSYLGLLGHGDGYGLKTKIIDLAN